MCPLEYPSHWQSQWRNVKKPQATDHKEDSRVSVLAAYCRLQQHMKDKSLKATTCWQGCMYNTRVHFACPIYFSKVPSSSRLIIFHYLKLEKEPTWVSRISTWDSTPVIFEDRVSSRVLQIAKDYQLTLGQYCNEVCKRGCILSNFCKERLLWCCDVM